MKAVINGVEVSGTPAEIAKLLSIQKESKDEASRPRKSKNEGISYDCYDPETGEWLGSI